MSKRAFFFESVEDTGAHKKGTPFTIYAPTEQYARYRLSELFPGVQLRLTDVGEPSE